MLNPTLPCSEVPSGWKTRQNGKYGKIKGLFGRTKNSFSIFLSAKIGKCFSE